MIIAVEGNLGSGKSTVLAELQHRGYTVVPEPVSAWAPMLERMYADPARWTLTFQTQVLAHYAEVERRYADVAGPVFVERSPVSALVFVSLATHRNALTVDELTVYMELHAAIGWEPNATVSPPPPPRAAARRCADTALRRRCLFPQPSTSATSASWRGRGRARRW